VYQQNQALLPTQLFPEDLSAIWEDALLDTIHINVILDRAQIHHGRDTDGLHRVEFVSGERGVMPIGVPETALDKDVVQILNLYRRKHFVLVVAKANELSVTVFDTLLNVPFLHQQLDHETKHQLLSLFVSR
jgi:hypothetical protein